MQFFAVFNMPFSLAPRQQSTAPGLDYDLQLASVVARRVLPLSRMKTLLPQRALEGYNFATKEEL